LAFAVAVFVVAGAAAGAAAQGGQNSLVFSSATAAELVIESTVVGEQAAGVRQNIEVEVGDGDDVVSQEELDAFEASFVAYAHENRDRLREDSDIRLDGDRPSEADLTSYELAGATGPVGSQEPIDLRTAIDFAWAAPEGDRHTLALGTVASQDADDVRTTFVAPPGFHITDFRNMPSGASLSSDGRTLNVTGSSEDASVVFLRDGTGGGSGGWLAGPSWALAVAAVAAAAVAAGRRP
jgi:hypothetical protein